MFLFLYRSALARRRLVMAAAVVVLATAAARAAETQTLEIATANGVHTFSVELVANDADRAKGLMFRRELPEGRGMLFDFQRDQDVSMWMQNTYISLDMIFINADGRIRRIAENTTPLSTAIIPSGGPVRGVLEVIAGTAKKFGIKPGDRVDRGRFIHREDAEGLQALGALQHLADDARAFISRLESVAPQAGHVQQDVRHPVVGNDETESLRYVEPFDEAGDFDEIRGRFIRDPGIPVQPQTVAHTWSLWTDAVGRHDVASRRCLAPLAGRLNESL